MIWAKRRLGEAEDYTIYQKRLADLHFMALSQQFVMVAKRAGRAGWDIYVGLPDGALSMKPSSPEKWIRFSTLPIRGSEASSPSTSEL